MNAILALVLAQWVTRQAGAAATTPGVYTLAATVARTPFTSVAAALVAACSGGLVNHGLHYGGATSYQNVHIESHGSVPVPVAAAHHGGYGGGHGIALPDAGHGLELGGGLLHHDGGLGLGAIAGGHEYAGHLEGGFDGGYGGGYEGGFHH